MDKTWLITPAFCKAALLKECLEHLYQDAPSVEHVVIDNHYPIDKDANRAAIKELCFIYGCAYVDSGKDLGLHNGINHAAEKMGFDSSDIVVGCDPDDRPSQGFVHKITKVMRADPTLAVLAATFWVIEEPRVRDHLEEKRVDGERVWYHPGVEMWSVCGFNWDFVTKSGGLQQTMSHYGGLESAMYGHMLKQGKRLAYLPDVRADAGSPERSNPKLFDPEYRQWKTAHVNGYKAGFEEWLKEFAPERL